MDCTVILQAEIADFELRLYAGGGIRWSGNGVFEVLTSKYDNNAASVQITFDRSVLKCLYNSLFQTGYQLGPNHPKSIVQQYRPVGSRSMGSDMELPPQCRCRGERPHVSLSITEVIGNRSGTLGGTLAPLARVPEARKLEIRPGSPKHRK